MKVLAFLALAASAGGASAQDIGGSYSVQGKSFDGAPYSGKAEINATSDVTCEIVWNTGGQISQGICMRQDNAFAASYVMGSAVGMAIYRVMPDGTLNGTWTISGSSGVGTETLTPN